MEQRPEKEVSPRMTSPGATKSNQAADDFPSTIAQAADHLAHFQRRVLVDSLLDAWSVYWERRARVLEEARPRPGEFHGGATREQLRDQWIRLTAMAQACRARAQVSPLELVTEDVDAVLGEAA